VRLQGKKVLVTGADGFIGSHLTEYLVAQGTNVRAFVFCNSFNSHGWLDEIDDRTRRSVEVFAGDIRDPHGVPTAMVGCDVVIHLAALIAIPYSYHSPDTYIDTTVKGTLNVVQAARDLGVERVEQSVTLLHCVTQYPAPAHSVNLRAMDVMADYFGLPIGHSDHTLGIDVAIAAVARGATTIEKHFTLDRSLPGPDHSASLEPEELERLVSGIRTVEAALGSAIKEPASEELANRCIARRSIVAARQIHTVEPFTVPMLTAKRPGHGMSPMDSWTLIGKVATRDYGVDDVIEP
jgi:hypothetical protein